MEILETRVYQGPNTYALWPMIRLRVDLGELEDHPTAELPGFNDRLVALMPSLAEHTCSVGEPGGFLRRLREDRGTWLGHVLEHVAIELQCLAGTRVSYGKTRQGNLPDGQYYVAFSFGEEAVGLAAGRLALGLIRHLLPPERAAHDPSPFDFHAELARLTELARVSVLDPATAALVRAAERRGIPWIRLDGQLVQLGHGRHQRHIHGSLTREARQAAVEIASDWRLARRILAGLGLPVEEPARSGSREADGRSRHSILVVAGKVVAVAEHRSGEVVDRTGDIHGDNRAMAELAVQAVGLAVGGVDLVCPDIARSCKETGGAITGIHASPDLGLHLREDGRRARDIAGPVLDQLYPKGAPSSIPIAVISGSDGSGERDTGRTTVARMVGHILARAGHAVGMATAEGLSIAGALTARGDRTGAAAGRLVLRDPRVDAAVLETSCGGIESAGLGWDRCSVGAVIDADSRACAKVLRTVVEVARDACVLDADEPRVAALARHSAAERIFVTANVHNELARSHVREGGRAVVLEPGISGSRLVLYAGEEQTQLLRSRQIPATLDGTADLAIRNAMFAAAVAVGLGVAVEDIREGLRTFAGPVESPARPEPESLLVDFLSRAQKRDEEARKEPVFLPPVDAEPLIQARRAG